MALRRSATGQQFVDAWCETSVEALFEPHLSRLSLYCFRLTRDPHKAAALAERVLLEARRKIPSLPGTAGLTALLYSVLREQCATTAPVESAPSAMKPLRAAGETP